MQRKKWRLLALLLGLLVLAGCAGETTVPPAEAPEPPAAPSDPAPAPEPAQDPEPEPDPAPEPEPEPDPDPDPAPAGEDVTLYLPDSQAEGLETVTETLELSPQALVDALAAHGALPEGVTVNDFSLESAEDDRLHLTLDLSAAFREAVQSSGTAGELLLLGSVTDTFLTAYDASSMTLTCDGAALETGHNIYDLPLEFMEF